MRKLFVFMMVSLDGYFEGENHDLSWHNVDSEFNDFAIEQLGECDMLLFGRKTYELMASYWPTKEATTNDPAVAKLMNSIPKIVVSRTITKPGWEHTATVNDNLGQEIAKLKERTGKHIGIFGSSHLSVSLLSLGLLTSFVL